MAFNNRLLLIVPGFGHPVQNDALFLKTANALAIGSNTITLAGLVPAVKAGFVRLKIYGSSGAGTVTSIVINGTDGTTTEFIISDTLIPPSTARASGA